jgi:hypothetical protein
MTDEKSFADTAVQNNGWLTAVGTSTWALVVSWLFGRQNRLAKLRDERELARDNLISNIDRRLSVIEGQLRERANNGRRTWPGDLE